VERLQISLFGQFSVTSDTGRLELTTSTGHLLAYLALFFGRFAPRTRIAGALWPDLPEARARANLSTSLWRLRQALSTQSTDCALVHANEYALGLDTRLCEIDVDVFKHDSVAPGVSIVTLDALARASYAAGLYKGDLLEDWDFEWCSLEREQLRQRYIHTLRSLAEGFERLHRWDLAVQYARRAAEADPSDEPSQRVLIRLLFRTGERISALSQFRRFSQYVRSELGVEPDTETMALVRQIKEASYGEDATSPFDINRAQPGAIPFVGRSNEREQIHTLIETAMAGKGGSMLLLGEAGIGKSRTVEWATEEWSARGGLMARGRCIEFNDPVPYQPVLDAISWVSDITDLSQFHSRSTDSLRSALPEEIAVETIAESKKSDGPWLAGKMRYFSLLLERLTEASRRRPILVVVEDLQWADASSVDFLAYLLEHARSMHILLLVTARPLAAKARRSFDSERLSRYCTKLVRLEPLGLDETAELVRFLLNRSRIAADLAKLIYSETEGNPLFIVETIRLLHQQGSGPIDTAIISKMSTDPTSPGSISIIPDGVKSAVEQRLKLIDAPALRVAQIGSVLGRSFDEEVLSLVSNAGGNRLSRAIGRLVGAGVFERDQSGYRFTHDKIRAVCYLNLPLRVRRVYHARAAAALTQMSEVSVHRIAWHQHSAGQWDLAMQSWETAADQAIVIHAYEAALSSYQHALSCVHRKRTVDSNHSVDREVRLLLKCDKVLAALGRPLDRRKVLDRIGVLCQRLEVHIVAEWFVRRALLEDHIGNCTLAISLARKAWSLARGSSSRSVEVDALQVLAYVMYRVDRFKRSLKLLKLVLRKVSDTKSRLVAITFMHMASIHVLLGDFASASTNLSDAQKICVELSLQQEYYQVVLRQGLVDKYTGRIRTARQRLSAGLKLARDANDPITMARATFHLAALHALEGNLGQALCRLRQSVMASRTLGYTRSLVSGLNEVAYSVGRLMGNYSWASQACTHALALPTTNESRFLSWMCKDSQVIVLLEKGLAEDALVAVEEALNLVASARTSIGSLHALMESLAKRGMVFIALGKLQRAIADLEEAKNAQVQMGARPLLVDTLTHLARAYGETGALCCALQTSSNALRLLAEVEYANHQPQRVFWHHYLILEKFGREPRLQYLRRAVDFVEAQAATVSKAQAHRLRRNVPLNRDILDAWERYKHEAQPDLLQVFGLLPPATPISVLPTLSSINTDPDVRA